MSIDFCCIIFLSDFNAITLAHNFYKEAMFLRFLRLTKQKWMFKANRLKNYVAAALPARTQRLSHHLWMK